MQILYLAHRIPYPPNKGDKIRSFNQIKYLAGRHAVDVACLVDDPADLVHKNELNALCRRVEVHPLPVRQARIKGLITLLLGKSISQGYFYRRSLQHVVDAWLKKHAYDIVLCFSSPMAEYLFHSHFLDLNSGSSGNGQAGKRPRLVMDFCDVDADKWSQYSRSTPFPLNRLYALESRRLLAFDARVNKTMDDSLFVSTKEAELFQTLVPKARCLRVIPNGVDHAFFHPNAASGPGPGQASLELLFTGAMDYQPNVNGIVWFCREVLPLIQIRHPLIGLTIVGANPTPEVRALASSRIKVTGFVPDIRPGYATAHVAVVPLRLARGVQNKVLEAMAMGKPVVATSAAVQGIQPLTDEPLFVADTAADFAAAVCRILEDPHLAQSLSHRGRKFVMQRFDWEKNMRELEKILEGDS
jgi:sugar transferase (PEP-CTERM/EpsH1 system associated)